MRRLRSLDNTVAWMVAAAACAACAGAPAVVPNVAGQQASGLVALGAADAAKEADRRYEVQQGYFEAKVLTQMRGNALESVEAAHLAALNVDGVDCLEWLALQDVSFEVVTDYVAEQPRRSRDACTIEQPIRLGGRIRSVEYSHDNMLMSCELARRMVRLTEIFETYGVTEVHVARPFSCGIMRGRRFVSQHAHGQALDVGAVTTSAGVEYPIEDWERRDDTPESDGGRLWYTIAHQLYDEHLFNIILTPEFDRAHRHWLHLDLTPNQHMLR